MADIKTILWDFDGTLAYRPGLWSGTMAEVLNESCPGSGITREDIRPHMKDVYPWDTLERPHPELCAPGAWWARLEASMAKAYEAVGIEKERAMYLAHMAHLKYVDPSGFILFEDTVSTLERLTLSGWRHVILSNHVPELPDIVDALGISRYFCSCVCSAETGFEKPHPQAFKIALASCGNPQTVWMAGDSVEADIEGAQALEIPAILVHTPNPGDIKYHADTLSDLADIIENTVEP